jgi:hypothetical protein
MKEVAILVTCDEQSFPVATMAFDTIRVGFPTARIKVYGNDLTLAMSEQVYDRFEAIQGLTEWHSLYPKVTHADWIKGQVMSSDVETLWVVDGDSIFWKSCEEFKFEHPLAGFSLPAMWNEFAGCPSVQRAHTSHLTVRPLELRAAIAKADEAFLKYPVYAEADYFSPRIVFANRQPHFYDSLAGLSHAVPWTPYSEAEMDCYDHVNSASFYKVMYERLAEREKFAALHETARTNPQALRGWWRTMNKYYAQCADRIQY